MVFVPFIQSKYVVKDDMKMDSKILVECVALCVPSDVERSGVNVMYDKNHVSNNTNKKAALNLLWNQ